MFMFNFVPDYISCWTCLLIQSIFTAMSFQNIHNYPLIPYSQSSQSILHQGNLKKATELTEEHLPVHRSQI